MERSVLEPHGVELVVATSGEPAELAALAEDVDGIMTCFAQIPAHVLEAAPRCLTVARYGVGLDNIAVQDATRLGIVVSNVPDYCQDEVADHALLMILALARRLLPTTGIVRRGEWKGASGPLPVRLRGKVLGLIGFGGIARQMVPRARAIGMTVIVAGTRRTSLLGESVELLGSVDELLSLSDVVSLHVPLTPSTRHLIDRRALDLMKPGSFLINTARGELIDTDALLNALEEHRIAGAGLDVMEAEPLPTDHPLRLREDVILTPHVAFSSDGAIRELTEKAARNVLAVLNGGRPDYIANPEVLDSVALRRKL